MAAPPGKRLIKLNDGRTIAVAEADARRYEYFSQGGKVMRRPRVSGPPPGAPQAPRAAPPPQRAAPPPQRAAPPPPQRMAPPPPQRVAPPPPAAAAPMRPLPPAARPPPSRYAPAYPRRGPRPPPAYLSQPAALGYNARVVIVSIVLVILIFSPLTYPIFQSYGPFLEQLGNFNPSTFNQRTFPKTAEFDLTRLITISAPGAPVEYNLTLSTPDNIPGLQEVGPVSTLPNPSGTAVGWFWDRQIARGGTETVNVTYHLKMTTYQWTLTNDQVGTAADVPQHYKDVYLDPEWKINPNSASVRQLANQITSPDKPYLQQLDDLYTWLLSHYTYQTSPTYEPKTPEETMADLGGDCDDFSVLFISMARYLGIPAWLELGLLYDEFRNEWGPHGWATVYIPLANGTGVEATIDVVNRLFLIRDPYHFSDWSSDGDAQHLQDYYTLLSYQPTGPVTQTPAVTVTQDVFNGPMTTTGTLNYFHG